ncbi:hypothetical protein MP228_012458 [Amoeboaphelidium protococcarum]|nr:hypothetical protein MP228_012458 [Amoeboaphelidium protococcarum]
MVQESVVIVTGNDYVMAGYADPFSTPAVHLKLGIVVNEYEQSVNIPQYNQSNVPANFKSPVDEDGHLVDIDVLAMIYSAVLKMIQYGGENIENNNTDNKRQPLLLSVPSQWQRHQPTMIKVIKLFYETFQVDEFYVQSTPLLSLYGYGQHLSGVLLYFGMSACQLDCITDTSITYSKQLSFMSCDNLRSLLVKALQSDKLFKGNALDAELVSYIYDNICQVHPTGVIAQAQQQEKQDSPASKKQQIKFTYKDVEYALNDAHLRIGESLFKGINGQGGLTKLIYDAVYSCDLEKRVQLLDNIIIDGHLPSGRKFRESFRLRLELEMKKYLCNSEFLNELQPRYVKFGQFPSYLGEEVSNTQQSLYISPYIGASVISKLLFNDNKNYLTRADYEQYGPKQLHDRLY